MTLTTRTGARFTRGNGLSLAASLIAVAAWSTVAMAQDTIKVPIRWVAVEGSPAADDPESLGQPDTDHVLWLRIERAGDVVWLENAQISFRSGLDPFLGGELSFPIIVDPNPNGPGGPGDILDPRIDDPRGAEGKGQSAKGREFREAVALARAAWDEPDVTDATGIIAINVRRIVDLDGDEVLAGWGGAGFFSPGGADVCTDPTSITKRYGGALMVEDISELFDPDNQEKVLAHELGHTMSLKHGNGLDDDSDGVWDDVCDEDEAVCAEPFSLMSQNSCPDNSPPSVLLTSLQIDRARAAAMVIQGSTVEPSGPSPSGQIDGFEISAQFADVAMDSSDWLNDVTYVEFAQNTVAGVTTIAHHLFGIVPNLPPDVFPNPRYLYFGDLDDNPATGGSPADLGFPTGFQGAELVTEVSLTVDPIDMKLVVGWTAWVFQGGSFMELVDPDIVAGVDRLLFEGSGGIPEFPTLSDVVAIQIPSSLLPDLIGTEFRVQAISEFEDGLLDQLPNGPPDAGRDIRLAPPQFPDCSLQPGQTAPGTQVMFQATGLVPNAEIEVYICDQLLKTVESDGAGIMVTTFFVPAGTPVGPALITAFVNGTAVTADCVLDVLAQGEVGACCLPDGTCEVLTAETCAQVGGGFQGVDTACADVKCPEPVKGACCFLPLGTCAQRTQEECAAEGGLFQGEGLLCAAVECPTAPKGACCLPDADCRVNTQAGCAAKGGLYQGDGTTCIGIQCEAMGACCLDAGCAVITPAQCANLNGLYQGDDTLCADVECPVPALGACCLPDGICQVVTPEQCATDQGLYQGDGTLCADVECPVTGACCFPNGTCTQVEQDRCNADGGIWQGPDTLCAPDTCVPLLGACCLDDGFCLETPADICAVAGGIYLGDFTQCGADACPAPTGACCLPDGSCEVTTEADCAGLYQGNETSCGKVECPTPPKGACCLADGTCQVVTQEECAADQGLYQGDQTLCADVDCNQPPGGCCFDDGTCSLISQERCQADGGSFQGDGSTCADCPTPTGACCLADGSCAITTEANCAGLYQGNGTACADIECDEPSGACCFDDGNCSILGQERCQADGGFYQGDDTTCADCPAPNGACCFPDDTCVVVPEAACLALEGLYQGHGTVCAEIECPSATKGACCFPKSGACAVMTQDDCVAGGGNYQGNFTLCADVECPQPPGACCFDDGACGTLDQERCLEAGGIFQGDNTTCEPDLCPPAKGACCLPDGTCTVVTQKQCAAQGLYQGNFTLCADVECPPPPGACCFPDGSCTEVAQDRCGADGGIWQGALTVCEPNECPIPKGACCFFEIAECLLRTQEECQKLKGVYQGDDTLCEPGLCGSTGACCLQDNTCVNNLTSEQCRDQDGFYQGDDTVCPGEFCEQQDCCENGDKPRALIMLYTGETCAASNNSQSGFDCTDFGALPDPAFIVASKDANGGGDVFFAGTVGVGDVFQPDAQNAGLTKLPSNTHFTIYDVQGGTVLQAMEVHTSCSQPLNVGDQFGAALLMACIPEGAASYADDCNGNGVPDADEIADGLVADCNGNGFPDECEIEAGDVDDCDENGVPDGCDVADGADDDNGNAVPDDCECIADLDDSGAVDVADLVALILAFGGDDPDADINADGVVDVHDLTEIILSWGDCLPQG